MGIDQRMRLLVLLFLQPLLASGQQAAPPVANSYNAKCAVCHGADLKGGSAGPILGYVRYHTDAELNTALRGNGVHKSLQISDGDLPQLFAEIRVLAGTNPAMATGGFTGREVGTSGDRLSVLMQMPPLPEDVGKAAFANTCNGCHSAQIVEARRNTKEGWAKLVLDMASRGAVGTDEQLASIVQYLSKNFAAEDAPPDTAASVGSSESVTTFRPVHARLALTDGGTLQGTLVGQSESDAQLLTADGQFHLLARVGDRYRDKPIAPKRDWLSYHGALSGNRYSDLSQINTGNVGKLAKAWTFLIPTSPRLQATPTVVDGVLYMTGWNEVYAVDGTTGQQIWAYRQPHTQGILSEAGRGSNHGVAISGTRLFAVMDNAHLVALDRRTGAKLWEVDRGSVKESVSATPAPLVVGDLVIAGVSGGEEGVRGFIDAYNVTTGERVWRFYTIPKRGEKGSETWIGQALEHGCGATWMTGSYDPALDLIYWGTGNPCPDHNGAERLGDNLYTSSVVALSAKTGELKWYFQFTPHDTHDWDSTQSMILIDAPWHGRERKLLVHGDRDGYFFVLDRTTGELLLAQPLSTKVTWTTGYDKDGRPALTQTSEAAPGGTALCPGGMGGTNWPDASYNPLTKLFYARVSDSCGIYVAGDDPLTAGNRWYGTGKPDEKARAALAALTKDYPDGAFIRAIDVTTGKKVWDYLDEERSGVLSTGGGLVIIGGDGGIIALDAKTGKKLATVNSNQTPTARPVFAASPMTYMVGGKQYIALAGMGNVTAYALPD